MVPSPAEFVTVVTSSPPSEEGHSSEPSGTVSSSDEAPEPSPDGMSHRRRRLIKEGLSADTVAILDDFLAPSTRSQYDSAYKKWCAWCEQRGHDPSAPNVNLLCDYLAFLFRNDASYSTLNNARSAISTIFDSSLGSAKRVSEFMQAAHRLRPPIPRYLATWDPALVLDLLRSWVAQIPDPRWSLTMSTLHTVGLLALACAPRSSELAMLQVDFLFETADGIAAILPGHTKTRGRGKPTTFDIPAYQEEAVCPVSSLRTYLYITAPIRGNHKQVFLSVKPPHHPVTSQTISRWLLALMDQAGVDISTFKPHSIRGAASSAALRQGLSMQQLLKQLRWSEKTTTWRKFYHRAVPLQPVTVGRLVLASSQVYSFKQTNNRR